MSTTFYLDHAATTPMRQCAIETWVEYSSALNPGGNYAAGRAAAGILDKARSTIGELLGADPVEVIFTGSGTEADNLAIQGLFQASARNLIISSTIEHSAVAEPIKYLAAAGAEVELMPVTATGHIADFKALERPAAVVSVMLANNETGAVQPVSEIIAAAQAHESPVHIDGVQAVGKLPIDFQTMGATSLAASGHKFGGPRGIGFLLAKRSPAPSAVFFGGGQERGLRPGTVDVASAAAMAVALKEAISEATAENQRLRALRDQLRERIIATIPDVRLNTYEPALPGHLNLCFPGAEGDSLLMLLDSQGFGVSTGSACSSGVNRASHVLLAMGVPEPEARGALRFSLGRTSTQEEVDALVAALPEIVSRARLAGMA
ncbi:cysteine desulfurase family protein [Corynebacterium caspium]|uniref:cysteine desulfurase family protein n=1 Tax=Corynebacterium caspium TaxID=234828 RepID=UPI0003754C20|nr:cysteine desulfurase family protein [Corynebacterium caspium]WKD59435.1 Cysteine desulfurase [Corynebacterium caspium DSM 44850]